MSMLTWHMCKTYRFQGRNILLKFFIYQKCLSKLSMNLFLSMLRNVLDVGAQKQWADVSPAGGVSRLKEMNQALAMGEGSDAQDQGQRFNQSYP